MKIAITADVHLRPGGEHPERLNALRNRFEQVAADGIGVLIIAGDLFDKNVQDFKDFEALCRDHQEVKVEIVPGNHDPALSSGMIAAENVTVHDTVDLVKIGETPFLFVPYSEGKNMGEQIAGKKSDLDQEAGQWILVSHGDFIGGVKDSDPYEKGIYMPLSRKDLDTFRPRATFLGHIHKADVPENLHGKAVYPGSPCGLDISETGRRKFLVYDTGERSLKSRTVDTDVLFFRESFLVIPGDDEASRLEEGIAERIRSWELKPGENEKVQLRVEARGYACDREGIAAAFNTGFSGFSFYGATSADIDKVQLAARDDNRAKIASETLQLIENELDWGFSSKDEPSREDVKEQVLRSIYQVGN
ncbi:MAG: metallophosphoesterase family protein [Planctomycetota bacterium]|nr:metallophosphoesterase family protein [Planctomycetota bacterium]